MASLSNGFDARVKGLPVVVNKASVLSSARYTGEGRSLECASTPLAAVPHLFLVRPLDLASPKLIERRTRGRCWSLGFCLGSPPEAWKAAPARVK